MKESIERFYQIILEVESIERGRHLNVLGPGVFFRESSCF